jgi:hypothetical protein
MSDAVRGSFANGDIVSGSVEISPGFHSKVSVTLNAATEQLSGYERKIVIINLSPDPHLWPVMDDVEQTLKALPRGRCRLVVFLNYDWAQPKWDFVNG